ncbi:MAG: hypothetical protein LC104_11515 [Bacteroidales bacterium]|nr:hypothetical protein [Bacteroidales bacterium]
MSRWLWAGILLFPFAAGVDAQPRTSGHRAGYIALRVNVGGTAAPGAGGAFPGAEMTPPGSPGFPPPGGGAFPMPPGAGGPGMPGGPGGQPNAAATVDFSKAVFAVIPVSKIDQRLFYPKSRASRTNPRHVAAYTPYGSTLLYTDNSTVQLYPVSGTTLQEIVQAQYKKIKTFDALLDVTGDALAAGLTDLTIKYAEELVAKAKPGADSKASPRVQAAVAALTRVLPDLEKDLPPHTEADLWKERFRAAGIENSPHYALIHFGESFVSHDTVQANLDQLEENLKQFYLWHALKGVVLPQPQQKLLVVLTNKVSEFGQVRHALDGNRVTSDSFYCPQYNIVVLAPERLDDAGRTFTRFVQGLYREGYNRAELVHGTTPPLDTTMPQTINQQALEITRVMTIALVDRRIEDETRLAAVSREGTRQLYAATDILAPFVRYPEWVENGLGNLFHKPKGPIVTDSGNGHLVMGVNLHFGMGAPNYMLHRLYRQMAAKRELHPDSAEMLRQTLLDHYFDAVRLGVDADPASVMPVDRPREIPLVGSRPATMGPAGAFPGGPIAMGGPGMFGPGMGGPGMGGPGMEAPEGGFLPPSGIFPSSPGGVPGMPVRDPAAERAALMTRLAAKSQVTSWALTYYLANQKLPTLLKFYAELGKLPRDMTLDRDQVFQIFCKTFGLTNADGTELNLIAFKAFAADWMKYMATVNPTAVDVPVTAFTTPEQGFAPGANFGPMGSP